MPTTIIIHPLQSISKIILFSQTHSISSTERITSTNNTSPSSLKWGIITWLACNYLVVASVPVRIRTASGETLIWETYIPLRTGLGVGSIPPGGCSPRCVHFPLPGINSMSNGLFRKKTPQRFCLLLFCTAVVLSGHLSQKCTFPFGVALPPNSMLH